MKTYNQSELSKTMKKSIKLKESKLNRKCGKIWECTNPSGERILYANFCHNRNRLIVTIGYWLQNHILLTVH